jgi:transcriptional regulator of acetoin/glycerol metabolism
VLRAVRPVLEERETALDGTGCALVLTDQHARMVARWGRDAGLEYALTASGIVVGSVLAESLIGTNSAGLALETGVPVEVHGAEHLAEALIAFSGVGTPLVHPMSRHVLGTLNVLCRTEAANSVLRPWLLEVAREIERRLRVESCAHEQLLLESFLTARHDRRHPIICLNDQIVLSNSAATRLLASVDQAVLWEQAALAIDARANGACTLVLDDGQRVAAHCRPIFDGATPVGAKIEIQLDPPRPLRAPSAGASRPDERMLGSLAGQSERWDRLRAEAAAARERPGPILLAGEPGTGKLAIARSLLEAERVDVFDAALYAVDEPQAWMRQVSARLQDGDGVVVLAHLESLDAFTSRTIAGLMDRAEAAGPRLVGTVTMSAGAAPPPHVPLDRFATIVAVPALRERIDDLRVLLRALTAQHAGPDAGWEWMPDAIQTLSRLDWPANVRSLELLVRQVLADRRPSYIDARSLPAAVRAAGARRGLSRLEQLEATAISEALQQSGGNKLEAAQSLGIARSTLYRRMRTLGIDLSDANY